MSEVFEVLYSLPPGLAKKLDDREALERGNDNPPARDPDEQKFVGRLRASQVRAWKTAQGRVPISVLVDMDGLQELIADQRVQVLGAWKPDGWPVGVTPVYDDEGLLLGRIGDPLVTAPKATYVRHMPDDPDGGPRPSDPYQVIRYMGWANRRYDLTGIPVLG